jgi:sulfur-oxidizing protein SoxX
MTYRKVIFTAAIVSLLTLVSPPLSSTAYAETFPTEKDCNNVENPDAIMKGWCVAINRRAGNCLACHTMTVDPWPEGLPPGGNIAPPLVAMKQRFPDKERLRAQIWDATQVNPNSVMPPFGKHKLISEEDIDNIVEFLLTI